jgi:tetrahydromethanopterin:alpha-L-glutamate ligase
VTETPGWHGEELRRVFLSRGAEPRFLSLRECWLELAGDGPPVVLPHFDGGLPEGVLVRDVPGGTLEQVILRLDVLHGLRELGVRVYNDARVIERTVDKAQTSFLLHRARVRTPPTCVTESAESAQAFLAAQLASGHQVVTKPLFGSLGTGLRLLSAGAGLPSRAETGGMWYLQRFVDTDTGGEEFRDLRVLVVGGGAVAAMTRRGAGWISNVAQGARCEAVPLDPELAQLAVASAAAVGADYAGVDLVRDAAGCLQVLEVNGIPAWRGLQSTTKLDLSDRIVTDFLARIAP